jgi:hypothetical protein
VRAGLVVDRPGAVALLPGLPAEWWGRPIEVHDLPTTAGLLSFAVRWHGERPALLWELRAAPAPPVAIGTAEPATAASTAAVATVPPADLAVTAPGLDPTWVGRGPTGEALLRLEARRADPGGA